jgi:hypothetical protein
MEVSGQLHAPAALPPQGKSPWYPLDRRMGGSQSWSGGGDEKISFTSTGTISVFVFFYINSFFFIIFEQRKQTSIRS